MRLNRGGVRAIRDLAGVAIAVIGLVACGTSAFPTAASQASTVPPTTTARPTTTTTPNVPIAAAQRAADKATIMAMWRADNDAWNASRTEGINAEVADSWPPSRAVAGMSFAECDRYLNPALWQNTVVDPSTIQPQPGWVFPLTHSLPAGRIYVMTALISARHGAGVQPQQTQVLHVVVSPDGHAYGFSACHD